MSFRPLSVWKGRFRRRRGAWGGNRRAWENCPGERAAVARRGKSANKRKTSGVGTAAGGRAGCGVLQAFRGGMTRGPLDPGGKRRVFPERVGDRTPCGCHALRSGWGRRNAGRGRLMEAVRTPKVSGREGTSGRQEGNLFRRTGEGRSPSSGAETPFVRAVALLPGGGNRRAWELPPGGERKLSAQGNPPECRMPLRKGKRRASEKHQMSGNRRAEQSIGQPGTAERAKNAGQTGNPPTAEIRLAAGNRRITEIRRSAGRGGRGERLRVGMLRGRHVLLGHRLQKGRQIGARHMKRYFSAF